MVAGCKPLVCNLEIVSEAEDPASDSVLCAVKLVCHLAVWYIINQHLCNLLLLRGLSFDGLMHALHDLARDVVLFGCVVVGNTPDVVCGELPVNLFLPLAEERVEVIPTAHVDPALEVVALLEEVLLVLHLNPDVLHQVILILLRNN